jgi:hypothetical protein
MVRDSWEATFELRLKVRAWPQCHKKEQSWVAIRTKMSWRAVGIPQ